jgi:N-acetylglucosaminyl-diphospho-decaprenol L-rhamnosyltransferase
MAPVGIIIITYNSGNEIGACLDAALVTGSEIVVVDNASSDGTVAEVRRRPDVRLIANLENRGFAAAANQGFAALNNPYLLLLNPDAVILGDLTPLRAACDLPRSAGAGGRLVDENGLLQTGFMARQLPTPATLILEVILLNKVWPGNPVNRRYRLLDRDYSTQFAVEQPAGAFLMVRRAVWEELGGLDDGYHPLWFEDVDFCRRIKDRGWLLFYEPRSVAKHTGGHSIPHLTVEKRRFYWYCSLLRFSSKTFGRGAHAAVCVAVVAGSVLRAMGESAIDRSFKPIGIYRSVIRLAVRTLFFAFRP